MRKRLYDSYTSKRDSANDHSAAKVMVEAGEQLFKIIEKEFGDSFKLKNTWPVEFCNEVIFYLLHSHFRALSKVTTSDVNVLMDDLIKAVCQHHTNTLFQLGFDISAEGFKEAFNRNYSARKSEYEQFIEDWIEQVSLRFGQHAAESLEVSEENLQLVAARCSLWAPVVYNDSMPFFRYSVSRAKNL